MLREHAWNMRGCISEASKEGSSSHLRARQGLDKGLTAALRLHQSTDVAPREAGIATDCEFFGLEMPGWWFRCVLSCGRTALRRLGGDSATRRAARLLQRRRRAGGRHPGLGEGTLGESALPGETCDVGGAFNMQWPCVRLINERRETRFEINALVGCDLCMWLRASMRFHSVTVVVSDHSTYGSNIK